MATNHTANYQLNQWEATDQVLRTDFNEDNVKVDTALKGLSTSVQQHSTQLSQLTQQIAALGNCQIYQTEYTGTGSGDVSLTFPHKPLLVYVTHSTDGCYFIAAQGASTVLVDICAAYSELNSFTWSGKTVSWSNSKNQYRVQCNERGKTYLVIALLDAAN